MRHPNEVAIRDASLEKLVAVEVATILAGADDPRLAALTIVRVEAARHGKVFRVCFGPPDGPPSAYPDVGSAVTSERRLGRAAGFVRAELAVGLPLKRVPELVFVAEPVLWATWALEGGRDRDDAPEPVVARRWWLEEEE